MLLDEQDATERYESPANLLNRLKSELSNPRASHGTHPIIPTVPTADQLIGDLEDKLAAVNLKKKAAGVMNKALSELNERVAEVQKPEKLAQIAAEMNKIVNTEEKNKDNSKEDKTKPQIIIFAPTFMKEENYQVIDANE